ncbi:MAG: hypothetical protein RIE77_09555 [Phycisphaerales bacterium]|jgi:hypothetical protein
MRRPPASRRGLSAIEVLVVVGVVVLLTIVVLPLVAGFRTGTSGGWQLRDSTQIRGITQACAIWAQNNNERYPTPSEVDLQGTTIARPAGLVGPDRRLDTTGNTFSLMIWNGFFPVELTVSPAEAGNVDVMSGFQVASPSTAVDPRNALWDPAFRGTPLDEWGGGVPGKVGDPSHNSYAQVPWFDDRGFMWGNTFSSMHACFGNRGPAYALDKKGRWEPIRGHNFGSRSTTLLMHGPRDEWNGNVGFNDQHVEYLTTAASPTLTWTFPGIGDPSNMMLPDNLFHAEHDHTRALIDEHVKPVMGTDGVGTISGDGADAGVGALDQKNNYLRPIARILPGENGKITAEFWID